MTLLLGKARSRRASNLGCSREESPGWFDVSQKTLHEMWCTGNALLWWSCQSSVAHRYSLLNHENSFCGGMFKLNAKSDEDLLLSSLSHFECDSHTVRMLTQWSLLPPLTSTVKSSLFTHVHSNPFSLAASYIDGIETILIVLTIQCCTFSGQTSISGQIYHCGWANVAHRCSS